MKFKVISIIITLFVAACIGSCSSKHTKTIDLKNYYLKIKQTEKNPVQQIDGSLPHIVTTNKSIPLLLIADNQTHDILGGSAFGYRNKFADKIANCSIRPPHLELFNYNSIILKEVLKYGDEKLILHLGDAANLSTLNEFVTFLKTMNTTGNNWFMAPGNHDGFYFGMTNPFSDHYMKDWAFASKPACDINEKDIFVDGKSTMQIGSPMTKDRFVAIYLAGLLLQPNAAWAKTLSEDLGIRDINIERLELNEKNLIYLANKIYSNPKLTKKKISFPEELGSRLDKLSFYINRDKIYRGRSYIVQSIRIDSDINTDRQKLYVIIADTSNYKKWMRFSQPIDWLAFFWDIPDHMLGNLNAGLKGQIGTDQINVLEDWVNQYKADGAQWVVAGHHPYKALNLNWQNDSKFLNIINQGGLPLYLSAHAHKGESISHSKNEYIFTELNIGSVTDYPMVFNSLEFKKDVSDSTTYLQVDNYSLINSLKPNQNFDISIQRYKDYLDYQNVEGFANSRRTEIKIKRIILSIFLDIFNKMEKQGGYDEKLKTFYYNDVSENLFSYETLRKEIEKYKNRLDSLQNNLYNDDIFIGEFKKILCFSNKLNNLIVKSGFFESDFGRYYAMRHSIWASTQENGNNLKLIEDQNQIHYLK